MATQNTPDTPPPYQGGESAPEYSDKYFYTDLPADKEKELLKSSAASISSTETALTLVSSKPFTPDHSLFINARGKALIRLPTPSSELEILIHRPDASLAYVSTRKKRCSGSATLSSPERGDLLFTEYFFGPNRDPIIHHINGPDEKAISGIQVTGKWTSRTTSFSTLDGSMFEWSYVKEADGDGKKVQLVVLERVDVAGRRRVAQLVRNERTRPPKTSKSTAGNGGELVFDADAKEVVGEELVVATCLLMLKKEIDRRRALQFAVLAGGAGGG
ncbi:hypothetical protein FQN52_000467 [Onygenales sp. PD_12]|nr:hypothetical protein FQN53_008151 [Emmonsiellopsis sp. PD_33]KAK2783022.1 hypothetical protein FQN52_000467 [Onygenales sp. PD_12]